MEEKNGNIKRRNKAKIKKKYMIFSFLYPVFFLNFSFFPLFPLSSFLSLWVFTLCPIFCWWTEPPHPPPLSSTKHNVPGTTKDLSNRTTKRLLLFVFSIYMRETTPTDYLVRAPARPQVIIITNWLRKTNV